MPPGRCFGMLGKLRFLPHYANHSARGRMKQGTMPQEASFHKRGKEQRHDGIRLGPLLCWAVVFADVGTSIYYVPGILYGTVGNLAGFFVMLTMSVFVLLTLKYAEVTHRFPQGGGVVTVAAQAMNHWVGCSFWSSTSSRLLSVACQVCCI